MPLSPQLPPLIARTLTEADFAPYGRVLQMPADGAGAECINDGTARRVELVADAQLTAQRGRPVLAISRATARQLPMQLRGLERHALGSQGFVPLGAPLRFVLVVARPGPPPASADLAAFVTDGRQGVLLAPGTWHHGLLALDAGDFLVIERRAEAPDCELCALEPPRWLAAPG
jgi:ureidoglycolate lyase